MSGQGGSAELGNEPKETMLGISEQGAVQQGGSENGVANGGNGGSGPSGSVSSIGDGKLLVEHLVVEDRATVDVIWAQADPVEAVITSIQIGARALAIASGALDSKTVDDKFTELASNFSTKADELAREVTKQAAEAGQRFTEVTETLLDEDEGSFVKTLETAKTTIVDEVLEMFDEDSRSSVIAKIEAAVDKAHEEHQKILDESHDKQRRMFETLIDPNSETGPIGKLNNQLGGIVKERTGEIEKKLGEIHAQLRIDEASAEVAKDLKDVGTQKGVEFEEQLLEAIEPHVLPLGDTVEDMSTVQGADGGKIGDFTVAIDQVTTRGADVRYVVEAKDRPLTLPKSREELKGAMSNRQADVGMLVFARQEQSPFKTAPFHAEGRTAWVVYDKDTEDDSALRFALMWARWVALREVRDGDDDVDVARIADLVHRGASALKTISSVKRAHTKAMNNLTRDLGEAGGHLDNLEQQLDEVFAELGDELGRAGDSDE